MGLRGSVSPVRGCPTGRVGSSWAEETPGNPWPFGRGMEKEGGSVDGYPAIGSVEREDSPEEAALWRS
jgi:hypothetical protein